MIGNHEDDPVLSYKSVEDPEDHLSEIVGFVETEFPSATGIMLVGSVASSSKEAHSDYDISIVHDDYTLLYANSALLQQPPYSLITDPSDFDVIALKVELSAQKAGIQIITRSALTRVCDYSEGYLIVLRHQPWDEYDFSRNAYGNEIGVRPRSDVFENGVTRMYLPITIEHEATIYTGVHTHMFLTNPLVIRDHDAISTELDRLWHNYLAMLARHHTEPNVEDVMRSLWKSERFNSETIRHIERKLEAYNRTL